MHVLVHHSVEPPDYIIGPRKKYLFHERDVKIVSKDQTLSILYNVFSLSFLFVWPPSLQFDGGSAHQLILVPSLPVLRLHSLRLRNNHISWKGIRAKCLSFASIRAHHSRKLAFEDIPEYFLFLFIIHGVHIFPWRIMLLAIIPPWFCTCKGFDPASAWRVSSSGGCFPPWSTPSDWEPSLSSSSNIWFHDARFRKSVGVDASSGLSIMWRIR